MFYQIMSFLQETQKSAYITFYSLNTDFLCYGKDVKLKSAFMKLL